MQDQLRHIEIGFLMRGTPVKDQHNNLETEISKIKFCLRPIQVCLFVISIDRIVMNQFDYMSIECYYFENSNSNACW